MQMKKNNPPASISSFFGDPAVKKEKRKRKYDEWAEDCSYEQKVPTLHLHDVPPVDILLRDLEW